MRLHRFYIPGQIGKEVRIEDKELLHQWLKVFRLGASDRVIVFNGGDSEYEGYFKILSKNEAVLTIDKERKVKKPTNIELHIFQSIIKKDNFELIVEKGTEIGVSAFHPIITARSEKKDLNIERLNKIAKEAAEQSGKTRPPEIFSPESLEKVISDFDGKLFVLDFDAPNFSEEKFGDKIGILIGPEGGWTENERDLFDDKEIKNISLGPQILRAETAAIVVSALILLK
ncbi:MAG: RsmE family RNA methyltransferase [Candidatus Paceibacterota bacterium]|jgi:16S rRNA (uracil1498-N3)-methyltransferase